MSNNEFLRPALTPERLGGGQALVYQLTANSVHPTRTIGRDEYGQVIEETVPIVKWREFVTLSGCINKVPLRTAPGNANDQDALQIEQSILRRVIASGFLPVDECPHTHEYKSIVGGPLVSSKEGAQDCGGKVGGCVHLHAVAKLRKDRAHAAWQSEQEKLSKMKADEIATMAVAISQAISSNTAPADLKTARQRGRETLPDKE